MRISSSSISMAASRNYTAETAEQLTTITRRYDGDQLQRATISVAETKTKQFEVEGGIAVFTTSADGMTRTDKNQVEYKDTSSRPVGQRGQRNAAQPQVVSISNSGSWVSGYDRAGQENPETVFLRRLLELLKRFTGKKFTSDDLTRARTPARSHSIQISASAVSARYQQAMSLADADIAGAAGQIIQLGGQSGSVNGHWTRQTVQSGFVAGEENTAFTSKGTVVTTDGRTLDFNISLEMSRSFEAAYEVTGKEEVYTDPLVINLDTDAAAISDVSFYFDLNCDGVAEEISALDSASGFLALDKNGDGEINDGSELFGARTGDGFGELAQYDQDGNGWIDEGDEIFSRLSVWTKSGAGDAQLLSLAKADVGAIFLGSQNTQYTLMDSLGEEGAMVRKTGLYLKESGGAGTVQHVDFKA